MSADNGVILQRTKHKWYSVIKYMGEYTSKPEVFATIEDAIEYIAGNCNDTEYGISLSGFEKDDKEV